MRKEYSNSEPTNMHSTLMGRFMHGFRYKTLRKPVWNAEPSYADSLLKARSQRSNFKILNLHTAGIHLRFDSEKFIFRFVGTAYFRKTDYSSAI
jgi:hypothetical protein